MAAKKHGRAGSPKPTLKVAKPEVKCNAGGWLLGASIRAALLGLVFVAFWPALNAEFVDWDDDLFIKSSDAVRGFTPENLRLMWGAFCGGHYHPLTFMSWALDYTIWGIDGPRSAFGFHLTNIVLHAANACLVYALVRRLIDAVGRGESPAWASRVGAAIGAGLFALHPLRAESVAWATERRDVLSALFLLASLLAYLRAVQVGGPGIVSRWMYAWSIVLLALSCLCKAWGMSFFAIVLVLDWYPLRRLGGAAGWRSRATWRVVVEKAPFVLIGVVTAFLAARAQDAALASKTLEEWGIRERIVQSLYGLWFYVKATMWPEGLSPLYPLPVRLDVWEGRYVAAYVFVGVAAIAMVVLRRRMPGLVAGAAIYVICLAPVLGILQSGEQLVADRYSYLASLVFSALLGPGVSGFVRWAWGRTDATRVRRVVAGAVIALCAAWLGAMVVATRGQTKVWLNTESVWTRAIVASPGSEAFTNYSLEMERQGRTAEADKTIAAAVATNPEDGRAWFVYANRARAAGRLPDAERGYKEAEKRMRQAFQAYVNLGLLYKLTGHIPEAIEQFRGGVADVERGGRFALSGGACLELGYLLRSQGDVEGAVDAFRKAMKYPDTREEGERELAAMGRGR
jgi:hypothetical protein